MNKFFYFMLMVHSLVFCQNSFFDFNIVGHVTSKNDSIRIISMSPDSKLSNFVFSNGKNKITLPLINSTFVVKGRSTEIHPVVIADSSRISDYIFIDKGENQVYVDLTRKSLSHNTSIPQSDYLMNLKNKFLDVDSIIRVSKNESEVNHFLEKNDSILSKYIKTYPNSYVGFWLLADKIIIFNKTNKYIKQCLINFSSNFKNKKEYKIIKEQFDIIDRKKTFINKELKLKDLDLNYFNLNLSMINKKYVLLDFWYSYCGPCISQFSKLKEIYSNFKNKNFEIVGISTDKTKDILNWKKIISEKNLIWSQYLDENSLEAKKRLIQKFPTNFLLNQKGEIIKQDISLEDLDEFLNKHLTE